MMFNWLSIVAGVFYMILGIFIILKFWFFIPLEPNIAYALGGLMMLYGLFRIIRAIYRLKQDRNEE
jgi:prepilin signal peptidase PulO-like enzyme (type II secretory pathway)